MKIRIITADQLTPDLIAAWDAIQRSEPTLQSPYFRPEYTLAVAAVRRDVEIAVLESAGEAVGFFPFQRGARNLGQPVGGRMSDYHGLIVRRDTKVDLRELLQSCRLAAWRFDHVVTDQSAFRPHYWSVAASPYIDLAGGWAAYEREQLTQHGDWYKNILRKERRAVRTVGPMHFEPCSQSPAVLQTLIRWKSEQYRRNGLTDVLAFDWTVQLLERVAARHDEAFSGMVSALYLGDALAAVVLSLRSFGVVHGWFSAYCPEFSQVSPGLLLWYQMAETFPQMGIRRIDLGKGPEVYKQHMMTGADQLAEGSVDHRPVASLFRRSLHEAVEWVRHSPLRRPLLAPGRLVRSMIETRSHFQ